jgi:hypothetical protein
MNQTVMFNHDSAKSYLAETVRLEVRDWLQMKALSVEERGSTATYPLERKT